MDVPGKECPSWTPPHVSRLHGYQSKPVNIITQRQQCSKPRAHLNTSIAFCVFRRLKELGDVAIRPMADIHAARTRLCVHNRYSHDRLSCFHAQPHVHGIMNLPYMDLDDFDAYDPEGLEDFDPFQLFIVGSGEVNFEEPDQPAVADNSISAMNNPASSARDAAVYNATRATRPLNLTNLPRDVQRKIYAMVLGPPTEVSIRSMSLPPHVQDSIVSPINLFLVSREVHRDSAAQFYGNTKFNMQFEYVSPLRTGIQSFVCGVLERSTPLAIFSSLNTQLPLF